MSLSITTLTVVASMCCYCYCHGFVLLSSAPAAAGGTRCFEPGTGYLYDYESTLLLNEADGPGQGKDVGFHVTGKVRVEVIWQRPGTTHDKVLQLEVSTRTPFMIWSIIKLVICFHFLCLS